MPISSKAHLFLGSFDEAPERAGQRRRHGLDGEILGSRPDHIQKATMAARAAAERKLAARLPTNQPGARRVDDRRVISGIIHVLKTGSRWCDCRSNTGRPRRSTTASTAGEKHGHRLHLRECPARRPWRKRGAKNQAIGPSRGGQTTKLHALTDVVGRPSR